LHREEIIMDINQKDIDNFIVSIEKDYTDGSKPMLVPRTNREYWLFTEILQRCKTFFKGLK